MNDQNSKLISPIGKINANNNNNNNSSFLHLSKKGTIKNVSEEFSATTGYCKKDIKGKHISEIFYKKEDTHIEKLIQSLSADTPFAQTKLKISGINDQVIKTELYLTLTSLKEGAPIFAIFRKSGIHQDKYDDLVKKKEKLQILTENTSHVQLLFDTDLKCLYISKSCYALCGYMYYELINIDLYGLIHHSDFEFVWETLNTQKIKKEHVIVFRIKHKNGKYMYVEARIKRIVDDFNSATHYAMYIHDASRQIRSEQQLLKSKNEAESANQLKNQFLACVSHEFRTPLNAIIGFSKILTNTIEHPVHKTYLNSIEKGGIQLLDMVNNLLDFSKIEKKDFKVTSALINLQYFFEKLSKQLDESMDLTSKKDLKVSAHYDLSENGEVIDTDEGILKQIFLNLIGNSIKFTKDGYVKFGCKPYGVHNYLFYVEDTGIGIPKEYHDRIFESLTQKDGSLTREHGGIGIGLSVTKKMIDLLNGEMWLRSEEGAGTALYFTLPSSILVQQH